MTKPVGHHASRVFLGQDGNLYLNGAKLFSAADVDITSQLEQLPNLVAAAASAEHGAGAIGTGVAPVTYRRTVGGVIITDTKIDLTGLASVATADDIIGLSASTPPAFIGRNVVATNGVIFCVEMKCLETPAGGDNDINLVSGSAADEHVGDAVTGANVIINGGDWVAGMQVVSNLPKITANHYLYLTGGAGDVADTYTAGQYVIRTYGHPLLT